MIYHTYFAKSLLLAALFFGTTAGISAAEGDLDPTFDGDGIVRTDNGSTSESIVDLVVQPDGKIIAIGRSSIGSPSTARTVIVRYNPNGSIDSTFGTGGKVIIPSVSPTDLALQPDGKIVFTTSSGVFPNQDFYVARLNSDGSFDATFNGTGSVTLDLRGTQEEANYIKILPDGKIVVAGYSARPELDSRYDSAIVRFNTDGSLDTTFDGDGKVFTMSQENLFEVIIQPDGKILAIGTKVTPGQQPGDNVRESFITVRYNPDGSLDTTFDGDGKVMTEFEPYTASSRTSNTANSITLQSDGKIIVAGYTGRCCNYKAAVVRYNVDGSLDSSFATGGKAIIPFSNLGQAIPTDVVVQADNKIVLAIQAGNIKERDFGVARLNTDGSLDLTFSGDGRNTIRSAFGTYSYTSAIAIQPDGKIIIGGSISSNAVSDFLLARFEATICLSNCFAARQKVADFDGDGKTDLSVFRNGSWFINSSSANNPNSYISVPFGLATDKLTPADFDGDGKTDIAVWRENVHDTFAYFYVFQSSTNTFRGTQFGQTGDDPRIVGDWDGDGKADLAVYRGGASAGAQSYFYYRPSSQPTTDFVRLNWGTAGDEAVRGDFDGDGRMDAAVFRPSDGIWYIRQSSNAQVRYERWGLATDKRVTGDFDGDGKTDLAVYRDGLWSVLQSSNNQPRYEYWGLSSDRIVAGDYDGDGRTDFAVWRSGIYYILQNSNSQVVYRYFGNAGDVPVASAFVR